jgi:hypothetical protein
MLALLSDKFHAAMRALHARSKYHAEFQLALESSLKNAGRDVPQVLRALYPQKKILGLTQLPDVVLSAYQVRVPRDRIADQ